MPRRSHRSFTPDGKRIIFCTNYFATDNRRKRNFDLALINIDGTGLERVTYNESFDGFPMFSPDGKKLVFASNRNAAKSRAIRICSSPIGLSKSLSNRI